MTRLLLIRATALISIGLPIVVVIANASLGWPAGWFHVVDLAIILVFAAVGWLISERQPGNAVGPLLLVFALLFALYLPADLYVHLPGARPGAAGAAIFISTLDAPMFVLVALLLIVFPDGRPPSPRWRPALVLGAIGFALPIVGYVVDPGPLPMFPEYVSPLGIPGLNGMALVYLGYVVMVGLLGVGVLALVVRWRRGRPVERAQIKWVVAAAAVMVLTEAVNVATFRPDEPNAVTTLLTSVAIAFVPIAMGIAILRYRLYEIDRIISRTLGYAVVTAILAIVFAGVILVLQAVLSQFTQGQTVAVAASTLAVFALFQPLRRRVQSVVDARFDRARYDGERTATAFAQRMRTEMDSDRLTGALVTTAIEVVRPGMATVWLRRGTGR